MIRSTERYEPRMVQPRFLLRLLAIPCMLQPRFRLMAALLPPTAVVLRWRARWHVAVDRGPPNLCGGRTIRIDRAAANLRGAHSIGIDRVAPNLCGGDCLLSF